MEQPSNSKKPSAASTSNIKPNIPPPQSQPQSQPSTQPQQLIRPQFHYVYKSQAIILDSQYNYEGNVLAVCNSQGAIHLYAADNQECAREPYFTYSQQHQSKKQLKDNALIKITWSLPLLGLFVSCSVYKIISLFKVTAKKTLQLLVQIQSQNIPLFACFFPSQTDAVLSVGCSDGSIQLYNGELIQIDAVQAHEQVVNCLAWNKSMLNFQKDKWVKHNLWSSYLSGGSGSSNINGGGGNNNNPINKSQLQSQQLFATRQQRSQTLTSNINSSNQSIFYNQSFQQPQSQSQSQQSSLHHQYMLSCSSDFSIKLWYLNKQTDKLKLVLEYPKAHQKQIRQVDWKPVYLPCNEYTIVSCSEDCTVKVWSLRLPNGKAHGQGNLLTIKASTTMKGQVYKAQYNDMGNLLAVSFCNQDQQKVETKIFKEQNGILQHQLKIQN